jgi:type 1 glutamine amidotransferase
MNRKRIVFHVGGPDFHPVAEQARQIIGWLDHRYECEVHDGLAAFEQLNGADLLVLMGLHWAGMAPQMTYHPLTPRHQAALEAYAASGRPIVAHHGAIASYDDWPRFGELVGFAWIWGTTNHSPVGEYAVRVLPTAHPVVAGVGDFSIRDELYYDIAIAPGLEVTTHAHAEYQDRRLPMVMTAHDAGKRVYLANGHDLRAFECPAMKTLWTNAIGWSLNEMD